VAVAAPRDGFVARHAGTYQRKRPAVAQSQRKRPAVGVASNVSVPQWAGGEREVGEPT